MSTPDVYYTLPIVNGYVVVPDDQNKRPNRITLAYALQKLVDLGLSGEQIIRIGPGGSEIIDSASINNTDTVRLKGTSYYLRLPLNDVDYYQAFRDIE